MKVYLVSVDVKVHITDGEATGSVTFGLGLHKLPTEEAMPGILAKVAEVLPDGFRLMSRHESTMFVLRERKGYRGQNLALGPMAAGEEWHDVAAQDTFSTLSDEPEDEGE